MGIADKLPRKDPRKEIIRAIEELGSTEQIKEFYRDYVVKIQKNAKREGNGNVIKYPKKYACGNINRCFEYIERPDKGLIRARWLQAIPCLDDYLEE